MSDKNELRIAWEAANATWEREYQACIDAGKKAKEASDAAEAAYKRADAAYVELNDLASRIDKLED